MKIAIDARMYGPEQFSGIGNYIKHLIDNLFEIDKNNEYIIFLNEEQYSKFNWKENPRVKKILVNAEHYSYKEQIQLPFHFAKEKFDLIHYPHFNSPILYRKKSICTIHDMTPFYFPGHKMSSKFRRWAHKTVFYQTIKKASQVIAVSEATKQSIIDLFGVNPNKIKVIHEGVDSRFHVIENNAIISAVKDKFGITKPYLFFVGVWRSHKNIEGLIKAFNKLKKNNEFDGQLVLGGRQDLHYTNVQKEIDNSPYKQDIITTGFIKNEDLPKLYNGAEVFVLPSFIEGFGLIGIEAQSCGCPVVSTNTSSMPEILHDSAIYFDPNDIEKMAKSINQVISDKTLKQNLIKKSIHNLKRFSWRKCAEETLAIYKSIK